MDKILIRPMLDEDVPEVQQIDRLSFTLPWPDSAYAYELHENPGSLLWVAVVDDPAGGRKVVGMVVVWLIVDEAHIATIAILPEYRGQHIAQLLIATALRAAAVNGMSTATLEVRARNIPAQKLYSSFGFEVAGFRPHYYQDNQEDALIMTLDGMDRQYLETMDEMLTKQISGEGQ
jgi:ribosomal-protein-alanine N-acetyltransferase